MLSNYPIDAMLLVTDMTEGKEFYGRKLGLEIINESEASISFRCGEDSRLMITMSTVGTKNSQTQIEWRVANLADVLTDLRSRGVEIVEYDDPNFATRDGIYEAEWGYTAWINDPFGNNLAILQYK